MYRELYKRRVEANANYIQAHKLKHTFNTGLDFSAMDFKSSRPAFTATEVRVEGAGAKAAADPINASRDNFIMVEALVWEEKHSNSCFPLNQ